MKTMQALRLLLVEDNEEDAELLLRELRRASFHPEWSRVDTEADFLSALHKGPDIILCDYSMPRFSGLRALKLLKESGLEIPFILISGAVGEDVAVEAMRDGATDYLLKDRIARVGAAVSRALTVTQLRTERNRAEEELRAKVEMLHHANLEREQLIERLKRTLSEKTVLLKEVHHRVKNNMAVIAALLGMQAKQLDNEQARMALAESKQRVLSMASIHEYLYATERLDRVNFGEYIQRLANDLFVSYSTAAELVSFGIEVEPIELPVDRAIPCGLILNELISNALKYAFPEGRRGTIKVRFGRLQSGGLSLSCQDDGIGIPENLEWKNPHSLGFKIISILTKQIDGNLVLDRSERGTRFELTFPEG
jgi:two-component sensor histidine kinase/CheY-like chemotaxis protein